MTLKMMNRLDTNSFFSNTSVTLTTKLPINIRVKNVFFFSTIMAAKSQLLSGRTLHFYVKLASFRDISCKQENNREGSDSSDEKNVEGGEKVGDNLRTVDPST